MLSGIVLAHHQNAETKEYRTSPTVAACKESDKVKELLEESRGDVESGMELLYE